MDVLVRLVEGAVFVACVGIIVRRYRAAEVRIVPGDLLLLTAAVFFVAPLAVSAAGVENPYNIYPAMRVGFEDALTRVLAAGCTLLIVVGARMTAQWAERRDSSRAARDTFPAWQRWLLLLASFVPLAVVAVAPDPGVYRTFAAAFVLRGVGDVFADPNGAAAQFHIIVTWSTYVSCVAFALWVWSRPGRWPLLIGPLVLVIDLWINGKRHIVVIFLLAVGFAALSAQPLSRQMVRRMALQGLVIFGFVLIASNVYQSVYRPQNEANGNAAEIFLTDFSRSDVLRLSIASESGLAVRKPLDYAGQSPMLHLRAIVPGLAGDRLISYADRVTAVAQGLYPRPSQGSLTTSLVSETIDNIGLIGIIVGPALMALLAALVSASADPLLRLIGGLAVATLLVVHVLAVLPIVGLAVLRALQLLCRRGFARHAGSPVVPLTISSR